MDQTNNPLKRFCEAALVSLAWGSYQEEYSTTPGSAFMCTLTFHHVTTITMWCSCPFLESLVCCLLCEVPWKHIWMLRGAATAGGLEQWRNPASPRPSWALMLRSYSSCFICVCMLNTRTWAAAREGNWNVDSWFYPPTCLVSLGAGTLVVVQPLQTLIESAWRAPSDDGTRGGGLSLRRQWGCPRSYRR